MIDRYSCSDIAKIWSDDTKYRFWYVVEAAFLKNLKGVQIKVPDVWNAAWTRAIHDIEKRTKHDVAAFVEWMESNHTDLPEARYIHYGLTSSDVLDTAFSLQLRATDDQLGLRATKLIDSITFIKAFWPKDQILGRTHGQAAEAITISQKLDAYINAIRYAVNKLGHYYGRLRGSTGDFKYFDENVEDATLLALGLTKCPIVDGQIIHRAYYAEKLNAWAILASVIAKIATDLRLLAQSEVHEFQEGFSAGQMGSSSMPHKKNPISWENLCGLARVIRGYQHTAMENIELWNERDISHSSAERIIFPDAAVLLGYMLDRMKNTWDNIVINDKDIQRNLNANREAIDSQREMLKLIDGGMTRKEAHAAMKEQHVIVTQQ